MQLVLFYFFAALTVAGALCVILHPRPTRALLSLIVTMFALAIIYLLLGAYFVAVANLIVYAGAVLVLFLFVIMLQGIGAEEAPLKKRFPAIHTLLATCSGLAFLAVLVLLLMNHALPVAGGFQGTIEAIATSLFTDYLVPFELTSLLLLVGVFAAVSLAKPETNE